MISVEIRNAQDDMTDLKKSISHVKYKNMKKKAKKQEKEEVKKDKGMEGISNILMRYSVDEGTKRRYISKEFQDFGYKLAMELGDEKNVGMYMKIAKRTDRSILEEALSFVMDAKNVKSKPRLFLWKMKKIREGK